LLLSPQSNENDCGFACLKTILASLNKDKAYLFLPNTKNHAFSFYELKHIAQRYHLMLSGVEVDGGIILLKNEKYPFIATITIGKNKHAVVVYRITKKTVYYYDPSTGKTKSSLENFQTIWDKKILKVDIYQKFRCPVKPIEEVSKKDKIGISIMSLISNLSLVVAILFVNKEIYIVIPIIFFFLCVLVEVIKKIIMKKIMMKMDDTILYSRNEDSIKNYYEFYLNYNSMKNLSLVFPTNVFLAFIATCFAIAIVLLNDISNIFYLIIPITLSLIDFIFIEPKVKKTNLKCSIYEENIKNVKTKNEFVKQSRSACKEAYKFAAIINFYNYLSIFIIIVGVIAIMAINQNISLANGVFYLFIGLFVKQNLTSTFKANQQYHDYIYSKIKIINMISVSIDSR